MPQRTLTDPYYPFHKKNVKRLFSYLRRAVKVVAIRRFERRRMMPETNLLAKLEELGGYWKYNGGKYLAKLTSGKISDTFANCGVLTCRHDHLKYQVVDLVSKFITAVCPDRENETTMCQNDSWLPTSIPRNIYVCGPAMGGITLAYEVSRQLGCTAIFTEPVYGFSQDMEKWVAPAAKDGPKVTMEDTLRIVKTGQELKRFEIPDGASVLFVEDVITTGKSSLEMMRAVMPPYTDGVESRYNVLPYILCLVNRSGEDMVRHHMRGDTVNPDMGCIVVTEFEIISLAEVNAKTWDTLEEAQSYLIKKHFTPHSIDSAIRHRMKTWIKEGCIGPDVAKRKYMEAVRPKDNWDLLTKGE